jgi:hypothetical protein
MLSGLKRLEGERVLILTSIVVYQHGSLPVVIRRFNVIYLFKNINILQIVMRAFFRECNADKTISIPISSNSVRNKTLEE